MKEAYINNKHSFDSNNRGDVRLYLKAWFLQKFGYIFLIQERRCHEKTNQEIALKVGDQAPDFSVPSTKGKIVLSKLFEQEPVVLALYPKDFTHG